MLAAAVSSTWQLWSRAGWPANHEGIDFAVRTRIYAAHLRYGDLLPLWSSIDNRGFGSPQPALYHKLTYLVSGTGVALGASPKVALVATVWFFLVLAQPEPPRLDTVAAANESAGCAVAETTDRTVEQRQRRFKLRCDRAAVVSLPIFGSRHHRVSSGLDHDRCGAASIPGLYGVGVAAGETLVTVDQPALWAVLTRR